MSAPPRVASLQNRLLRLVLGFAVAVWLGAAVFTWFDAQQEIDELLDGHLAQAAALLLLHADEDDDDVYDTPVLRKYAPQVVFQVFLSGRLVARSANVGVAPLAPLAEGFATVRREDGEHWRVVLSRDTGRDVAVLVGEKMTARQAILWAVMRSLLAPLVLGLPLFGAALWWSVRQGLAPIRLLRGTLEQRLPNASEPVSPEGMPRELLPLVHTLNGLLARIDGMVQLERRFTADAAHELRTPIAAIRAQAQVALGAGDDVAEREHALQVTLAGCDRASHLVDQLLTLARLEVSAQPSAVPSDLTQVVQRVLGELTPYAQRRQQTLQLHAPAACPVAANEVLLGVLVRNLVDNALRYSPPGAQVALRVQTDAHGTYLRVQDSGPGMSDADIAHLGERFFRVLGSEQTGSGLGWSIVRRVLVVMGAEVQVGRAQEWGGLDVQVHWPASTRKP